MKVTLEGRYKDLYTISEYEAAKRVIKELSGDGSTAKEWAEYAAREAIIKGSGDFVSEVLIADAHTARNCRVYDAIMEGSGEMDVWVHGLARTYEGFIEFGAYLTDIWQTGAVEYQDQMYIRRFKEVQ